MARSEIEIFPEKQFGLFHDIDENPSDINFILHNHPDLYEVVMLIDGDCEFHVEGNVYKLCPMDFMLVRPFEMHHIVCRGNKRYDRIVMFIHRKYFEEHKCERFLNIFENRELGTDNILSPEIADNTLSDAMLRLLKYSQKEEYDIAEAVLLEFLYLLNESGKSAKSTLGHNERVRNIIMYINDNLNSDLSLDSIASHCFISKTYMCNLFKKNTGYTINRYIIQKRVLLTEELHKKGYTLLQACTEAGFNSYSGFYRAYISLNGHPPRKIIAEDY